MRKAKGGKYFVFSKGKDPKTLMHSVSINGLNVVITKDGGTLPFPSVHIYPQIRLVIITTNVSIFY